jgi:hypothetical protein
MNNIGIWVDTPVVIRHKCTHIRKGTQKSYNSFITDNGDIPVGSVNNITNKYERCVNHRGFGYAARKRMKYRKNKKKEI